MSANDTWMPLYLGDYLADTGHLSTAEHGAYLLLLMHYWRNGPLQNDPSALMRIVRAQAAEWRKIKANVLAFFTVEGDGLLHQKRMDQERGKCSVISEKRREAGRAGALAKWRPNGEHPPPDPPKGMANAIPNDGKCHPVAIDLPPGLPDRCQPFATTFATPPVPINQYKLESKKEKQVYINTYFPSEIPGACARSEAQKPAPEVTARQIAVETITEKVGRKMRNVELVGCYPIHDRDVQIEAYARWQKPRPKPSYFSNEVLRTMPHRQQALARAGTP